MITFPKNVQSRWAYVHSLARHLCGVQAYRWLQFCAGPEYRQRLVPMQRRTSPREEARGRKGPDLPQL